MTSSDFDSGKDDLGWRNDDAGDGERLVTRIRDGFVEQLSSRKREPEWMRTMRVHASGLVQGQVFEVGPRKPSADRVRHGVGFVDGDDHAGLAERGVVFCDMDAALHRFPDLVKAHFGTVISPGGSELTALNTAVWSGGSFVYVPRGVEVEVPLQSPRRRSSEPVGAFEHTVIVADEGSAVHFIDGCSSPVYTSRSLQASAVEIVVKENARVSYTSIQNWTRNVENAVTKRARVEAGGHVEWIEGDIGGRTTVGCPGVDLVGDGASAVVSTIAFAGAGQHQNTGAEIVHAAANTASRVVSKSVSTGGGAATHHGLVRIDEPVVGATSRVRCDALLLDDASTAVTPTHPDAGEPDAQIDRMAAVVTIAREQLFYLRSRGLSEEQAVDLIVNGFIEPIVTALPVEYAVEWPRLIELHLAGSIG